MKQNTIKAIESSGIIAILRGIEQEDALKIGDALLRGGIDCMEITYTPLGDYTKTADTIEALCRRFGSDMNVGAGTVMFPEQVEMTAEAGGKYIISPNTKREIITMASGLDLVSIPGAFSPTECEEAFEAGADFVKLFPITNLGSSYVKAITAPLSHIKFLAVGGIDENNLGEFIKAGALGIGVGGNLGFSEAIKARDFSIVTEKARKYSEAMRAAKGI